MSNEITNSFNETFRDFVIEGVPTSGRNEPAKAEIRATGVVIQTQVNAIEANANGRLDSLETDVAGLTTDVAEHETRIDTLEAVAVSGSHRAEAVATITTANVNLSGGGIQNGTTHGGVTVSTGQRVLVRSQTAAAENGIYIVPGSGAAARSSDANSASELLGIAVKVTGGTVAGQVFGCVTPGPITVGTTALSFEKIDDESTMTTAFTAIANGVRGDLGSAEPGVFGGVLSRARATDFAAHHDNFDSGSGTRLQWFVAFKMGAKDRLDAMRFVISDEARSPAPVTIEGLLYRQPASLASALQITDISQYELVDSFSAPVGQYYTVAGGFQTVTLPIASKPFASVGERFVYVVRLRDGSNNMLPLAMGFSRHYPNDEEGFAKGGYSTATTLASISAVSANAKIYAEVLSLRNGRVTSNLKPKLVPVDGNVKASQWGVDFTRVIFNVRPTVGVDKPGMLGFYISQASSAVYVRLRVFLRPYKDGNYGSSPYVLGSGANDLMVYSREYLASDLYNTASVFSSEAQMVRLDLDGMPSIGRDQIAMFEVTCYASNRITLATFRVAQASALASGEITLLRGAYATANPPSTVDTPTTPHFHVLLAAEESENVNHEATPSADRTQFLEPVVEFQTTTASVSLPKMAVWTGDCLEVIPAQTVAVTDVLTPEGVTDNIMLRYNQDDVLSCRWFSTATVTRVSDSVVLTPGTDYELASPRGTIRGLQNVADFAVTVAYAGYRGRCDLITYFPSAGYTVWPGTARLADPDNWKPTIDTIGSRGRLPVAEVLVHRAGVEVIDKTQARFGSRVLIGRENEIEAVRQWNREKLASIRLELERGNALTWIAYGDSITAWAGGTETIYQTVPNGPSRDTQGALTVQVPADSLTHIGIPPVDPGDGVQHWYGSFNRRLHAALQTRYGVTIDFKNLGIGGTDTSNTGSGTPADRYNGSNAARLAGILAAKGATGKTIVMIGFGTNEPDDDNMVNNLTTIARYCIDNGMIPVLVGQPAIAYSSTRTVRRQQRNDARILRTARSAPCAYVPLGPILHDNRAASGIFRSLQSGAGGVNHPGPYEHSVYADWIDFMCFR